MHNPSDNVAVVALQGRIGDEASPTSTSFSAGSTTTGPNPVKTEAQLFRHQLDKPGDDGALVDAVALEIPAADRSGVQVRHPRDPGLAEFEVRLPVEDALAVDNRAFAVVGNTRKAQVLAVTAGNRYLLDAFNTPHGRRPRRRPDRHARGSQGRGGRCATFGGAVTTWSSTTAGDPTRPPRPTPCISASSRRARRTTKPRPSRVR